MSFEHSKISEREREKKLNTEDTKVQIYLKMNSNVFKLLVITNRFLYIL